MPKQPKAICVTQRCESLNICINLFSAGFCIPADVTFNDFCTADSKLSVNETVNDAAIVQSVNTDTQATMAHPLDEVMMMIGARNEIIQFIDFQCIQSYIASVHSTHTACTSM